MADPGFPVGGGADSLGGADLQCIHFLAKTYAKMKEMDPVGGGMHRWCPLDPPMLILVKILHGEYLDEILKFVY